MSETRRAECSREQAEQLIRYDHHRVRVGGRLAILLTYQWMETGIENVEEPLRLRVVFHSAASQHPPAPPDIQALVDGLRFEET